MSGPLVLASASPRRKRLLEAAGLVFSVRPAGIDESLVDGEDAVQATMRLALAKTAAVASKAGRSELVLGADTTVACQGLILGKPSGPTEARDTLMLLAGRNHTVFTAWALAWSLAGDGGFVFARSGITRSTVRMREFTRAEAVEYVAEGEALDKAGAYAVQGSGRRLVAAVWGSYDNVIGLPVEQVCRALRAEGLRS